MLTFEQIVGWFGDVGKWIQKDNLLKSETKEHNVTLKVKQKVMKYVKFFRKKDVKFWINLIDCK